MNRSLRGRSGEIFQCAKRNLAVRSVVPSASPLLILTSRADRDKARRLGVPRRSWLVSRIRPSRPSNDRSAAQYIAPAKVQASRHQKDMMAQNCQRPA